MEILLILSVSLPCEWPVHHLGTWSPQWMLFVCLSLFISSGLGWGISLQLMLWIFFHPSKLALQRLVQQGSGYRRRPQLPP